MTMSKLTAYDPAILVEMAQEHLNAAHDLMWSIRTAKLRRELVVDSTKETVACRTWSALWDACSMVGADRHVVLATVKALDRHARRQDRQRRWPHYGRGEHKPLIKGQEEAVRRGFAKTKDYRARVDIEPRPWKV